MYWHPAVPALRGFSCTRISYLFRREGVFGEHVFGAGLVVGEAGEGEEQVGEAVEVDQNWFGEWLFLREGNRDPFGAAADGAGKMERGGGMGAAGEDEIREGRQLGVRCIDGCLKRRGVCRA